MNINNLAPIILFTYNRVEHTRITIDALKRNKLASFSELYIFSDAPKNAPANNKVQAVRNLLHKISGFKKVEIIEQTSHLGLATSIITGVSKIIKDYGKVIVLEDDIETGEHFLEYMNQALNLYSYEKKVWHIAGWRDPVENASDDSSFFYPTMDCWGWATWKDRWEHFEKNPQKLKKIFTQKMIKKFNIEGADPWMFLQIDKNISGEIDTWAIFWYATIFLNNGLCLAPTKSLVRNIGFDNSGENCGNNDGQLISASINNLVTSFPQLFEINRVEFEKNIAFIKQLRRKNFSLLRCIYNKMPGVLRKRIKAIIK